MTPDIKTAAIVALVVGVAAFGGGYKVADWRLTGQYTAEKLEAAKTAAKALADMTDERNKLAGKLSAANDLHTTELRKAQNETNSLRDRTPCKGDGPMPVQLIIATIIAAVGFSGGFGTAWKIQAGNINAKEVAYAQQELANVRSSAAADIRRLDNAITAQNAATARAVGLRRDRDSALTELGRLRLAVNSAVHTANTDPVACPERAAALGDVLTELGRAGAEIAGQADRHASDVKTLTEAWPK